LILKFRYKSDKQDAFNLCFSGDLSNCCGGLSFQRREVSEPHLSPELNFGISNLPTHSSSPVGITGRKKCRGKRIVLSSREGLMRISDWCHGHRGDNLIRREGLQPHKASKVDYKLNRTYTLLF